MRVIKNITVFLILVTLVASCNKKIVPSSVRQKKGYDTATFSYFYVEAIKQKLTGNGGEALKFLEQSLKINPASDAAYYQMAQIVAGNGDVKTSKSYLSKALAIDNENVWYLMMIAGLYYQEKNLDSAIYYYETAVKFFPEKENLQVTLGSLYSENNQFDKANSVFDSLAEKFGENESTVLSSIKSLLSAKRYDEALEKANQLIESKPGEVSYKALLAEIYRSKGDDIKALDVYRKLIDRNPDDPQTLLALSDFLVSEGYYEELFSVLNNIILNENIKKEEKFTLFGRLIEVPGLAEKEGDKLIVAIRVLEAAYPDDNVIPLLRPEVLVRQNKLKDAGTVLEEIIKKDPDNYYSWEKLLVIYLQLGDFKSLMTKGKDAATRFNRSFPAKILYANGALESGEFTVALDELKKAEILAGDDKQQIMQVLTMRADIYYRMKDFPKAFELFEEALKTDSEDLTILNNYAYYLAEQNVKLKEAEEMARKVIEKEKTNTTFLDTYGWVLYKRGKLKEAAKVMEGIINSGEKPDAEWYEHYAYILKEQNNCEKAVDNWNTALKLDPSKKNLIKEIENCKK